MARQQVERAGQGFARIILAQGLDILGCLVGILVAHQKADDHVAEGIIHSRVKLRSLQVTTQMAIADLVRGIFPDFAEQQRVGLLGEHGLFDLGQEIIRKLVGHIEAPAMSAGT